jgi:hypothetical protein
MIMMTIYQAMKVKVKQMDNPSSKSQSTRCPVSWLDGRVLYVPYIDKVRPVIESSDMSFNVTTCDILHSTKHTWRLGYVYRLIRCKNQL